MSKAEERALERFPVHEGASKEWTEMYLKKVCAEYIEGYHQAEKDLELTWEDVGKIISIDQQVCGTMGIPNYTHNHQQAMEEVLKRFKAQKGE
jgi:hypothetical protein